MKFQESDSSEYRKDGETPSTESSNGETLNNTQARLVGAVLEKALLIHFAQRHKRGKFPNCICSIGA